MNWKITLGLSILCGWLLLGSIAETRHAKYCPVHREDKSDWKFSAWGLFSFIPSFRETVLCRYRKTHLARR